MTTATEIRSKVLDYLDGRWTLDEFDEWLGPVAWEASSLADPDARDLVYEIELLISEHTSGHRDEAELKAALRDVVEHVGFVDPEAMSVSSSTSVITTLWPAPQRGRAVALG